MVGWRKERVKQRMKMGVFTRLSKATRAIFEGEKRIGSTVNFLFMNAIFFDDFHSLEEKEYLLETVFKQLVDLVFVYDLEQHRIIIRNPAFDQLMGVSEKTPGNMNCPGFIDMVHPEDKDLVKETFQKLRKLSGNDLMSVEARIKNALGTYTYYHTRLSLFKQQDGVATQVLCISQDMSEKIKYELQKQRSINTLKELSFITSHELRHEYAKIQSIIQLIDNQFIDEKERSLLLIEAKQSIQIINSTIFKINHKLSFNQNDSFFESSGQVAKYKKVLLIDDDALTNMLNKKIIQVTIKGMPIEIFTNVPDALEYLSAYDDKGDFLIFLDINFPEKDGWDFLEEYVGFPVRSKVIMLSSSIDNKDRDRARRYEMVVDYITKPLSIDFVDSILKA